MKLTTKLGITAALAVALGAFLSQGQEKTRVERSLIVTGTTNALNQARLYMDQGSSWLSIHRPFMSTDTNQWEVEATFYK